MFPTVGRLETLLRALQTQQRAIDVANHNIANQLTPGYSRQVAMLGTTPPYTLPTLSAPKVGQLGTGVTVMSIQRIREGFLDVQYRTQAEQLGNATAQAEVYRFLETIFNEPDPSGVAAALDGFWHAWQEVVSRPEDVPTRTALVESSQTLANRINGVRNQVAQQRDITAQKIAVEVERINQIGHRIASLNAQISGVLGAGQQPNDLMDARDLLLDELSQFAGATTVVTPDGAINVYYHGRALVDRSRFEAIRLSQDAVTGELGVVWSSDGTAVKLGTGSVSGYLEMYNVILPRITADVEAFRDTLVNEVNAIHQTGYGLTDPGPTPPGRDFFEVLANGDIRVIPALIDDPSLIATSALPDTPGNSDVALAIANLREALTMDSGTTTINGFYRALVARIGSEAQRVESAKENSTTLAQSIDRQRMAVSGVSLDEEAVNLIKYQHAYQAAARAMTVVDEMLDQLINRTGLVGR